MKYITLIIGHGYYEYKGNEMIFQVFWVMDHYYYENGEIVDVAYF